MTRCTVFVASAAILCAFNAIAAPSAIPYHLRPRADHRPCEPESFARVLPADATIEHVAAVPEGGSYGEGAANRAYSTNPTDLPGLCAVTVRVQSSATSSFRFGLFLPDEWNSRFLVVGNGGFAGGINWLDMAAGPRAGMASLSTDTGHNSTATDSTWARSNPESKADWGWRAMHGSTALGKELIGAYYTRASLARSYYSGCSTGGRQGLREMQAYPDSFDGALIGAPAWWTSHLNPYITQVGRYNLPVADPKRLSDADLALLAQEVVRQCDGADGVLDGVVSSPDHCTPDLARLLCPADDPSPPGCLTAAQLAVAQEVYNDWYLEDNTTDSASSEPTDKTLLYPGLNPSSEKQWSLLLNGTEPSPYGVGYARNFLFDDGAWDWRDFDAGVVAAAEARDPGAATADDHAGMGRARARGAKVLLYHGLADGLVPARGTEVFYARTAAALARDGASPAGGGALDDFMRMFLVPGLQHCWGTAVDAAWNIGGAFQAGVMGSGVRSVPGFESAEHDALMALVAWVEEGRAVERIVATTWVEPLNPDSGVRRQRPVCAWPRRAVWDGLGHIDVAASWNCLG